MTAPYDITAYPPFAVTVDLVVLAIRAGELRVLVVKRGNEPFRGRWALPGGFVHRGPNHRPESLDEAAARELREETGLGLKQAHYRAQLGAYGDPKRDPRGDVVTVAYLVVAADIPRVRAGGDAVAAEWLPVATLEASELAFDHHRVITDGVERVRELIEYTALAAAFCGPRFSLSDLRRVYEIVWGLPVNYIRPDRFHHKMKVEKEGWLRPASKQERPALLDLLGLEAGRGRIPQLYETAPEVQSNGFRTPLERRIPNPQGTSAS